MIQPCRFLAPGCALLVLFITAVWPLTAEAQNAPEPPTGLYAASIVGNEVQLRWTAPTGGPPTTDYVLEAGLNPGEALISNPLGSTNPAVDVLAPTGAFYVRVYTLSGAARSAASNEIRVFVNQPIPPSAPANLLATVDGSSVTLAWRNTFQAGTPESVMLDVAGLGSLQLGRLTEVIRFTGVPAGTYTVSVRASNSVDESSPSNAVTLTIPSPCSGVPQAPSAFLVFREDNTLFVRWESPLAGPAPVGYTVTVTGAFNLTIDSVGRELSGAVPSGTYNLSVRGSNTCGAGAPTAVQSVVVP